MIFNIKFMISQQDMKKRLQDMKKRLQISDAGAGAVRQKVCEK